MNAPASDSTRRKRIAVIAVHGVADQQPEETANTAANLLLHMPVEGDGTRYRGFKTHRLRIAHRAVKLIKPAPTVSGDASEQCQHQFLRGQLEEFEEPDPAATYQTIRNEGVRADKEAGDREVHIYEMYWADLSRLGNSFYTFFVELYQLLFHLCTVGAKTARFARAQHEEIATWRVFSWCIHLASYFIRLPIPIGNLFVLAIIAFAAAAQIPTDNSLVRTIVIAVAAIGLASLAAWGLRKIVTPWAWPGVLLVFGGIAGVVWYRGLFKMPASSIAPVLHVEVWLLLLGLLYFVVKAYNRRHLDAFKLGIGLAAVATVILLGHGFGPGGGLFEVCKASAILMLKGIGLAWVFAILVALTGWIVGARAVGQTNEGSKPAARRAVFTANLTTALTGTIMLIINIALWGMIPALIRNFVPEKFPVVRRIAAEMQHHMKTETIMPGMATVVILIALAALLMLWVLIPTVRSEMKTPAAAPKSSWWIGRSLTNAFRVMTYAGYLGIACFGGLLAVFSILKGIRDRAHFGVPYLDNWDKPTADELFIGFSGAILFFIIAPFFLKGSLKKLSAGFRQGLDIALDVINYLREHPADSTIRAQILARYVSLLRYVCNWESPVDGRGYDSIVIFAHSQGTVITVDLLRFLQVERDPELGYLDEPDRIQLFTMGSPLRQLYGLRFPHIYGWARHSDKLVRVEIEPELGQPKEPKPLSLPDERNPNPDRLLGVGKWVNAYRSGDYVGRNLWRGEKDDDVYLPGPISRDSTGKRREFCIGGGAHVHYWDETAPRIVEELDRLIANA